MEEQMFRGDYCSHTLHTEGEKLNLAKDASKDLAHHVSTLRQGLCLLVIP
jgi:hypothetical protein